MQVSASTFTPFAIYADMLAACNVVGNFDPRVVDSIIPPTILADDGILLTGEGSSRIFPAKYNIHEARRMGIPFNIYTEGGRQAAEYNLKRHSVIAASNSGKTAEIAGLMAAQDVGLRNFFGVTAHAGTPVANAAAGAYILGCGEEGATAATKSVIEQALFMRAALEKLAGNGPDFESSFLSVRDELAGRMREILTSDMDDYASRLIKYSKMIYFAGRNDGVAEELTLKTMEIARVKAMFLEGTYALHGVEETMETGELVILVNPFKEDMQKYDSVLRRGAGVNVVAISDEQTIFPTVVIPHLEGYDGYLQLVAGWRLLLQAAVAKGINPDKPVRARKIGNSI